MTMTAVSNQIQAIDTQITDLQTQKAALQPQQLFVCKVCGATVNYGEHCPNYVSKKSDHKNVTTGLYQVK